MKKYLIIILLAFIFTLCIIIGANHNTYNFEEIQYTVSRGDTLWSIAEDYCPEDMDIREYIYLLDTSANIYEGQTITILKEVK